ncbi:MAG: glycoside hydrolase family 32 protein [Chloroflexota bacterium]
MTTSEPFAVRQRFAGDPHRPQYHFLPPSNWMNDPNGLIQWKGKYHLFYQHNPFGPLWGNMHWGHATSADLVHWTDLPIGIAPTPGSADEAGIFSGCCINDNGVPTVFYTGTRGERNEIQTQCIATSKDDLLTWEKYPGNPILPAPPVEAIQHSDFRDPFVWKEADAWYMVIGSRIQDVGGAVFLYRSTNLTDWEYLHPLLINSAASKESIWECPNFFQLGDEWILIISGHTGSSTGSVNYFVGSFENHEFAPVYEGVLDYGTLYAPLSFVDDQQRRLLFGWLREARSEIDQRNAGWSGVQSIPRVLTLDKQHRIHMTPVPEIESIRGDRFHMDGQALDGQLPLDVRGLALDIEATFEPEPNGSCGVVLTCSADQRERTEIVYEADKQHLIVRKVTPEADGALVTHLREVPHDLLAGEALKLRILLDSSVIEIIANERTSLTSRVYPLHADSDGVRLLGTKARLQALDIWKMPSIWS